MGRRRMTVEDDVDDKLAGCGRERDPPGDAGSTDP